MPARLRNMGMYLSYAQQVHSLAQTNAVLAAIAWGKEEEKEKGSTKGDATDWRDIPM